MFRQKKFLNTKELQGELDAWSDDADEFNIVITPPEDVEEMTDNEDLDDDIQIMNKNLPQKLPVDLSITTMMKIQKFLNLKTASRRLMVIGA